MAAEVTTYAVTGLAASATYTYRVRAVNAAGSSPVSPTATAPAAGPPTAPDVVIERLAASPATVGANASLKVTYAVANRGTAALTQTYSEKIYLSRDARLDSADTLLATSQGHTADLATGAARSYSQTVTMPAGTVPGNYFLLVQGDAAGIIGEADEDNNVASFALLVRLPDLVIEGLKLSASSVRTGVKMTVAYKVANRGVATVTATYTEKIYLSADSKLDGGDVLLATSSGHTGDLAPGASRAHSLTVRIPGGTAAGSYFVLVTTDALGVLPETDENNVSAMALTVLP